MELLSQLEKFDAVSNSARVRVYELVLKHYKRRPDSPWNGKYLVELEKTLKAFYASVGKEYDEAFRETLPEIMKEFYDRAKKEIKTAGVYRNIIGDVDTSRIKSFLDSSFKQVAMRTDKMSFDHIQALRRLSADVFRETSLTGATRKEVSRQLLERALQIKGFEFTDKSGAKWSNKSYFQMLARTELMNAGRATYDDKMAEEGFDIMKLTTSGDACDACARFEGKPFSLSGKTPGIPTKQDLVDAGVFHPNCTHSYSLIPANIAREKYGIKDAKTQAEIEREKAAEVARKAEEERKRKEAQRKHRLEQLERAKANRAKRIAEEEAKTTSQKISETKAKMKELREKFGEQIDFSKEKLYTIDDWNDYYKGLHKSYVERGKKLGWPKNKMDQEIALLRYGEEYEKLRGELANLEAKKAGRASSKEQALLKKLEQARGAGDEKTFDRTLVELRKNGFIDLSEYENKSAEEVRQKREKEVEKERLKTWAKFARKHGMSVEEYVASAEKKLKELSEKSNMYIRFDDEILEEILSSGRIKTQFEVSKSGGLFDNDTRSFSDFNVHGFGAEVAKDGFKFSDKETLERLKKRKKELRPVSGFLSNEEDLLEENTYEYGNCIVKLKRETRKRTTFTGDDSLCTGLVASKIDKPKLTSLLPDIDVLSENVKTMKDCIQNQEYSYIEAQFHGGVFVEDIEEIILDENQYEDKESMKEVEKRIKKYGVKFRWVK